MKVEIQLNEMDPIDILILLNELKKGDITNIGKAKISKVYEQNDTGDITDLIVKYKNKTLDLNNIFCWSL